MTQPSTAVRMARNAPLRRHCGAQHRVLLARVAAARNEASELEAEVRNLHASRHVSPDAYHVTRVRQRELQRLVRQNAARRRASDEAPRCTGARLVSAPARVREAEEAMVREYRLRLLRSHTTCMRAAAHGRSRLDAERARVKKCLVCHRAAQARRTLRLLFRA